MLAGLDVLLDTVLIAARREAAAVGGFPLASRLASRYRTLVLQGPERVSDRLGRGQYDAARDLVAG
jgi:hypothetical protein